MHVLIFVDSYVESGQAMTKLQNVRVAVNDLAEVSCTNVIDMTRLKYRMQETAQLADMFAAPEPVCSAPT